MIKPTLVKEKSTHRVEVFILSKDMMSIHSKADSLSIIKIPESDYTYVCKTSEWAENIGKLVCHILPDSFVDNTRSEFSFLEKPRIRARRIRGVVSYGILVLAPPGLKVGDNAAEILGVTHYDPEMAPTESKNAKVKGPNLSSGEVTSAPKGPYPTYDVDAFLKYAKKVFQDGEIVFVTEKIHGSNSRFVYQDGSMHCGSRNEWKSEFSHPPKITLEDLITHTGDPQKAQEVYTRAVLNFKAKKTSWWTVLDATPALRAYCEIHPGHCVYGEVFGSNKNFKYGVPQGQLQFRAFDIMLPDGKWMDADKFIETCETHQIPHVPVLAIMPFDFEKLIAMAEGNTTFPDKHIREGCVVKPQSDRWSPFLGRVSLKIVNPKFLEIN